MQLTEHPIAGVVRWQLAGDDGRIKLDANWIRANITTVTVPELKGVPTYGGPFSGRVDWFTGAAEQLLAAWAAAARLPEWPKIRGWLFWGGSWVPRLQRGSKTKPSNHTFGTAFDICPAENPWKGKPAAWPARGSILPLVPVFKAHGFAWGGEWRTKDGMHFEVSRIWHPAHPKARIVIRGELAPFVEAEVRNGRVWAAARPLAEALGAQLAYRGPGDLKVWGGGAWVPVPSEQRGPNSWVQVAPMLGVLRRTYQWQNATNTLTIT